MQLLLMAFDCTAIFAEVVAGFGHFSDWLRDKQDQGIGLILEDNSIWEVHPSDGDLNQGERAARQQWDNAMKQLKTPGRMHRLKRHVEAQLPVHRQYIPAGMVYFAELTANQPITRSTFERFLLSTLHPEVPRV